MMLGLGIGFVHENREGFNETLLGLPTLEMGEGEVEKVGGVVAEDHGNNELSDVAEHDGSFQRGGVII
jgi:hypothetical protein